MYIKSMSWDQETMPVINLSSFHNALPIFRKKKMYLINAQHKWTEKAIRLTELIFTHLTCERNKQQCEAMTLFVKAELLHHLQTIKLYRKVLKVRVMESNKSMLQT